MSVPKRHSILNKPYDKKRNSNMNKAFNSLKKILPSLPSDRLSKISTLKLAAWYIQFLTEMLQEINRLDEKNYRCSNEDHN